jgi:hypothetical protein
MVNGDTAQIERIKGRYQDQKEVDAAVRAALREYDPRIKQAAKAVIEGNHPERIRLQKEIISEKHFAQDIIVAATNAEIKYVRDKISDARKAKAAGNDEQYEKAVDALIERGYSEDFVLDALS